MKIPLIKINNVARWVWQRAACIFLVRTHTHTHTRIGNAALSYTHLAPNMFVLSLSRYFNFCFFCCYILYSTLAQRLRAANAHEIVATMTNHHLLCQHLLALILNLKPPRPNCYHFQCLCAGRAPHLVARGALHPLPHTLPPPPPDRLIQTDR